MFKKLLCFIISLSVFLTLFQVSSVLATGAPGQRVALQNPLNANTFGEFVDAIANIVIKIGGVLAVIFIIISGFLFVTARGNEEQLGKAKTSLTWTIVGTAVLLGASVIAKAIVNFFETS